MALKQFYGFDNFGGEVVGGTGNGLIFPKPGAGILGTPYEQDLAITYGNVAGNYGLLNSVGVTGLEAHKIGQGAERRNLCVLARTSGSSYVATMRLHPQRNIVAGVNSGFYRVTGFTYVDLATAAPTNAYNLLMHRRATSLSGIVIRNAQGLTFYNQSRPCVLGQPYYIEIVEKMAPSVNASTPGMLKLELWCDGELIIEFDFTTLTNGSVYASNLEINASATNLSQAAIFGVADLYTTDEVGEAPFNGRMGPQIVLPTVVTAVDPTNWSLVGAADALTALSTRDDASYVQSPKAVSQITVSSDIGLKVGSQANGLQYFGRVRRDASAGRTVSGRVERDGGVVIGTPSTNPTGAAFTDVLVGKVLPATPAERLLLDFPDSGKVQIKLQAD